MSLAVVGADHLNKSGPARRFEIAMCVPGEPVALVPEPHNPADPHAVAVYSHRGIQIGYVKAERAPLMGSWLARGRITDVIFQEAAPWGATIRIGLDGEEPVLPMAARTYDALAEATVAHTDFWPDFIPPDD